MIPGLDSICPDSYSDILVAVFEIWWVYCTRAKLNDASLEVVNVLRQRIQSFRSAIERLEGFWCVLQELL